jgi:hypothetical protein
LSGVPRPALALPGESSATAIGTRKQPAAAAAKDAEDVDVDRLIAELTANK